MARRISVEIVGDASQLQRTFGKASASASVFGRDLSHASRGALAGSGAFRSLGRSIAFASGGFLAFASAGQLLRKSIDAAETTRKAFRSLGAQAKATGTAVGQAQADIGRLAVPGEKLGFNKADLEQGFTVLLRGSGSAKKALAEMAAAEDVARAKGMTLSQGALIVNRALISSGNSARSLGIHFPKAATAAQKLAIILQRFAGQARANTTETDRFNATLFNTETIIGNGLLPTLNRLLGEGQRWLAQMNESGRLQKDVAKASHDVGEAVHVAADAFKAAAAVIRTVDRATGGLENTLKDVAAVWLVLKARTALIGWGIIAAGEASVGTAAEVAAAKVGILEGALARLRLLGPIAIAVGVTEFISFARQQAKHIATQDGPNFTLKGSSNQFSLGGRGGVFGTGTSPLAPGVAGSPLNPFAPNRFSGGDLGIGALTGSPSAAKAFAAAAAAVGATRTTLGQFNLLALRLADAQRTNNTILQRSILVSEEQIVLQLRDQAKKLKDRTQFAQQAASIESQIRGIDQQAASKAAALRDKAKQAAAQLALGGVPLSLQLAKAKADALAAATRQDGLTTGQTKAAKAIRDAENRAIKSHKLSMQGLIDAWNEIASVNSELATSTKGLTSTYHAVSTHALTAGLGLARDTRVALEGRLAQSAAHRGYAPNGPAVLGQTMFTGDIHLHGVQNVDQLAAALAKKARHQHQRRGTRR